MTTPEAKVKSAIRTYLDSLAPRVYYVVKDQGAMSLRGIPDLLVCCNGRFLGLEVKSDDGETSKLQEWTLAKIRRAGGNAEVVRSVEEVKRLLTPWLG